MKKRILAINPNAKVQTIFQFLSHENVSETLTEKYDYIIDAIDDINAKIWLVKLAKSKNINIVSALGAGNRSGLPTFEITDVYTDGDRPHLHARVRHLSPAIRNERAHRGLVPSCERDRLQCDSDSGRHGNGGAEKRDEYGGREGHRRFGCRADVHPLGLPHPVRNGRG